MMHRYVAIVATGPGRGALERARARLAPQLAGWDSVLVDNLASVWVWRAAPSQLGHRAIDANTCLIGRDFQGEGLLRSGSSPTGRWGGYVVISIDNDRRRVEVVRDPTGRIECWRLRLDGVDAIFSHYEDVVPLQDRPLSISWDFLQYHLHNEWSQGAETGYSEVTEVLPGERLTYTHGQSETAQWWRPAAIAGEPFATVEEALVSVRSAAEASVSAWSGLYRTIALNLSGGLDSAIVLGLLRQHAGHEGVVGVNFVIPHVEGDERAFARDAAAFHSIDLIEEELSAQTVGAAPSFSRRLFRPAIRSLSLGYDEVSDRANARIGAEAFFTGEAGDHLFYESLGVTAACDYVRLRAPLAGLIPTAHHLAQISRNTIWAAFGAMVRDHRSGAGGLRERLDIENPFLSEAGLADPDYGRFAHPWVLDGETKTPPAKRNQIEGLVDLQRHYFRYGRADTAEEVHPLFSQPLMEACLRIPAYWFGHGRVQRGLQRAAFADLLPESIRRRRTKSYNSSHWLQMMERDLTQTRSLLLEGRLAACGLVKVDLLNRELTPLGLASTRSNAALINCLTTEMWVQQAEADQAELNRPTYRSAG